LADRILVRVTGELDLATADLARTRLLELVDTHTHLVVDLGELAFIDSSGLSALVAAHKRAAGRGTVLVLDHIPPTLSRMLAITGLDRVFAHLGGTAKPATTT
ncbi:STAS domain-containing protein, partial [Crossiella equi]